MAMLDMRIGAHLRTVHDRVQNDWFGLPSQARDELYSWQEAFTGMLETLLHEARDTFSEALPYDDTDVRRCLSRAIGFFLFDDCEVPSLVSLAGDDGSVIVDFNPELTPEEDEVVITSLLPLSHALWGDPLLEAMFIDPNEAFLEGYGGSPVVFARQKTKRLWYTFFLALVVLLQASRAAAPTETGLSDRQKKIEWAREELAGCAEKLKNAPCY
ncbi:hypothetical protein EIP86_006616 [Pleurotus ostreatoroseus]|nr:hypothetical protein EIP86_006616 [Pleurotus ostreatoroseus]